MQVEAAPHLSGRRIEPLPKGTSYPRQSPHVANIPREAIQAAGELLALWQDLLAVTPEGARFGQAMRAFAGKLAETSGLDETAAYAEFQTKLRVEPIGVAILACVTDGKTRVCMWEGNPQDWASGLSQKVLRSELTAGRSGVLDSEDLWARSVFLNGARDALVRCDETGVGALWLAVQRMPGIAPQLALWAILHGESHYLEWRGFRDAGAPIRVKEWPWSKPGPLKPNIAWANAADECREVARRLRPTGLPLVVPTAVLRHRNPPTGPRKGISLTVTEQICWYLIGSRSMTPEEVRDALGMDDVRQIRSLMRAVKRKHAKWPRHPSAPLTSRMVVD